MTPIVEYIRQDVVAVLKRVSVLSGYRQSFVVRDDLQHIQVPQNNMAIVVQDDPETLDGSPFNKQDWRVVFHILLICAHSEADTRTVDFRLNQIASDVLKALQVDYTRGNFAWDTRNVGTDPLDFEDGATRGLQVNVEVSYRTKFTDPYQK